MRCIRSWWFNDDFLGRDRHRKSLRNINGSAKRNAERFHNARLLEQLGLSSRNGLSRLFLKLRIEVVDAFGHVFVLFPYSVNYLALFSLQHLGVVLPVD